jgi:hypothetical protein
VWIKRLVISPVTDSHLCPHIENMAKGVAGDVGQGNTEVSVLEGGVKDKGAGASGGIHRHRDNGGLVNVSGIDGGGGDGDTVTFWMVNGWGVNG